MVELIGLKITAPNGLGLIMEDGQVKKIRDNICLKITAPNGLGLIKVMEEIVEENLKESQNNCPKWFGANTKMARILKIVGERSQNNCPKWFGANKLELWKMAYYRDGIVSK